MKRILSLLVVLAMVFGLAACGSAGIEGNDLQSTQPDSETEISAQEEETAGTDAEQSGNIGQTENSDTDETKILVAYFSRTGENYSVGYIEKGNTHIVADMIAERTGGNTFEIRTITPYPDSYDECTDIAKEEQNENARPELADSVEGMEDYDVIFLGYPNWWGDMPMAVYTFLESYDFSGKTIVPFCTHEGSGLSATESRIADSCPDAEVLDGLAIRGSVAQNSQDEAAESVAEWLRQAGFTQ